jgi:hypothetical protein
MLPQGLPIAIFLIALMASAPVAASGVPPVRVGQEWTYAGSTRTTGGERAEHSYVTTVTVVPPPGAQPEVARFRETGNTPFRPSASLAWLASSREEDLQIPEAAGIEPGVRLADAVPLPIPFGTARKAGERWISRAPFFGLTPPFPQNLPFRHRVLGAARVGLRRCWRIERTIAAPLPLTAWVMRVLAYRELFWVDASRGVLLKYQGSASFQNGPAKAPATWVTASLEWKGLRTLPAAAARARGGQARLLTEAAGMLFSRSGEPGEVRLQQAQARLASLRQSYPHSAYAPAAAALGELVRMGLGDIARGQELERQHAALIGKLAPVISLKDLEGKAHTLGEYRGKLILLNVFASW